MSKYLKDVSHLKTVDPYRLQELYQMHPCAEHVVKKMLVAGERSGGKSLDTDIADCIWTLQRWQEMRAEDAAARVDVVETTCLSSTERTFERAFEPQGGQWPEWATHRLKDHHGATRYVREWMGGQGRYVELSSDGLIDIAFFPQNGYVDGTLEVRPK